MLFNHLEVGSYFQWKDKIYRKIAPGRVLDLETDVLLDFGLNLQVKLLPNYQKPQLSSMIQYLGWALLAAHKAQFPSQERMVIHLDLLRGIVTTEFK